MDDKQLRRLRQALGRLTNPPSPALRDRVRKAIQGGPRHFNGRQRLPLLTTVATVFFIGALAFGVQLLQSHRQLQTGLPAERPLPGMILLVAGGGSPGLSGDGGDAKLAGMGSIAAIVVDDQGNILVADNSIASGKASAPFSEIRQILPNEVIGPLGGTQAARFTTGLTVDQGGNVFMAVAADGTIWKYSPQTGGSTLVVTGGPSGYSGEVPQSATTTNAGLYAPTALAVDGAGNLYVADSYNNSVRKVVPSSGMILRVAGIGTMGYSGDGGPAVSAELSHPMGLAFDRAGNLYIADSGNQVVREVDVKTGAISTIAGSGKAGYEGDGRVATSALLYQPKGLVVDARGDLFIADSGNNVIREVMKGSGMIYTVVGNHLTPSSDADYRQQLSSKAAMQAELLDPDSIALDRSGNLLVADAGNRLIRKVVWARQ